jgi:hypothetical protein
MRVRRLLMKTMLPLLALAFLPTAWSQGIQNRDIYLLSGPSFTQNQTIGGSNVMIFGSTGYSLVSGFGYQVVRKSAVSLWVDINFSTAIPAAQTATIPGSISLGESMTMLGVRLMVPVHARISFFVAAGGGYGDFNTPDLTSDNPPDLKSSNSYHGVFDVGGGVDIRLSHFFSIRLDARDYISGRELGGLNGRNHFLPAFGPVFHF